MSKTFETLLQEAREKQFWLFSGDYWFSPDEFEQDLRDGKPLGSPEIWSLGDPVAYFNELVYQMKDAVEQVRSFSIRLEEWYKHAHKTNS